MATLTHEQARRAYDRIGSWQDSQRFYEDAATGLLLRHGEFEAARSVFEFGCGTGRFARRLFDEFLPASARYRGVDLSPRMVALAKARLAPLGARARVILTDGTAPVAEPAGRHDRFVSNFVFDLLSSDDIQAVLAEAHRMLHAGGLLCLSGLSSGSGFGSRLVAGAIRRLHSLRPALIGGCRPIDLVPFLSASRWQILHQFRRAAFGIPTEAVIARVRT